MWFEDVDTDPNNDTVCLTLQYSYRPISMKKNDTDISTVKRVIYMDRSAYSTAMREHRVYTEALNDLIRELKPYGKIDKVTLSKLKHEPRKFAEELVLSKYAKVNLMKLSFKKLVDVLELDIKPLEDAIERLEALSIKNAEEPNAEDYTTYATTKEQISRLDAIDAICEGLNKLRDTDYPTPFRNLSGAFNMLSQIAEYDMKEKKIEPIYKYVFDIENNRIR